MDSLQFYEGPPRKKPLAKRRKRIHPLRCEIHDTGNQAVEETPIMSNNEMDEVQLQSRSEPQFKIPRTVYTGAQTVAHELASSISDFASKTASCNEFLGREGTEIEWPVGVDSSGETRVDSAEPSACELISPHAIEDTDRSKQSHDNTEHATENSALSLGAENTESPTPRSAITLPCHEPNHPLLSHPAITSCEACTFKDGQIFALVQILRSFHHGQLRTREAEAAPKSRKRISKGLFTSTFSLNLIRTVVEVGRTKDHPEALRSRRRIKRSKETEADTNATTIYQEQLYPRTCTRSGRVSKATQKILHSAL